MRRFHLPSPSMAVAVIAVAVATGGTSYAVTALPKNSVGRAQIKKHAVTTPKLASSAAARIAGLTYKKLTFDIPPHTGVSAPIPCPRGLAGISGGLETPMVPDAPFIVDSHPIANGWEVMAANAGTAKQTISVYAVCAKSSPAAPTLASASAAPARRHSYAW